MSCSAQAKRLRSTFSCAARLAPERLVRSQICTCPPLAYASRADSGSHPPTPSQPHCYGRLTRPERNRISLQTYLIRALRQTLGARCVLVAPTGVAADNIGGRTYQQLLPVASRGDLNRPNIRPKGKRKDKLCKDWKGVTHAILDEMSMLGRRNLGQIDELLRCATNRDEPFGGINLILVGVRDPTASFRISPWVPATPYKQQCSPRFSSRACGRITASCHPSRTARCTIGRASASQTRPKA